MESHKEKQKMLWYKFKGKEGEEVFMVLTLSAASLGVLIFILCCCVCCRKLLARRLGKIGPDDSEIEMGLGTRSGRKSILDSSNPDNSVKLESMDDMSHGGQGADENIGPMSDHDGLDSNKASF